MKATLGVCQAPSTGKAEAWLLLGEDPGPWLEALERSGATLEQVQLFPLPRSARKPSAAGALLLARFQENAPLEFGLPLRRIGQALFVLRESELAPPVTEAELDLLLAGRIGVLLPGTGLVLFTAEDALRPDQLIERTAPRATTWQDARTGLALATRLIAIDVEQPPAEQALLEAGRDGIGSLSLAEQELEKRAPSDRLRAALRAFLARSILRWSASVPRTSATPTWVNKLEDFAQRIGVEDLLARRQRQLAWLLGLLQSDPDQGLRFALPLHGLGARGMAAPGGDLPLREAEYDASRLGRAVPADPWNVDPQTSLLLGQRYRALANRELELGRYRRAAYIFAELLGDLRSAAGALATGRFYLEAAELYRGRLKDRVAAASCLEKGGLLQEALEEWRALGKLERVAELLEQLGRREEAREVHRERVRIRLQDGDRCGAADVLDRNLGLREEALRLLEQAWPDDPNLERCLASYFVLLRQEGNYERARRFLAEHAEPPPVPALPEKWLRVLVDLAKTSLQRELADDAADAARVLVGNALGQDSPQGTNLLHILGEKGQADALLRKDTTRRAQELENERRTSSTRRPGPSPRLVPCGEFKVSVGTPRRCSFDSTREHLYVFHDGGEQGRPRLDDYSWRNGRCVASWSWPKEPAMRNPGLCRVTTNARGWSLLVSERLTTRRLELQGREVPRSGGPIRGVEAGTPDWVPPRVLDLVGENGGGFAVAHLDEQGKLKISRFGSGGTLVATFDIVRPELEEGVFQGELPASSMAAINGNVYVQGVDGLMCIRNNKVVHWTDPALTGAVIADPHARREGLVIVGKFGCRFGLIQAENVRWFPFGEGPTIAQVFMRNGLFARLHPGGLSLYRLGDQGAQEILTFWQPRTAFALVAGERPEELALIYPDGLVERLRFEA